MSGLSSKGEDFASAEASKEENVVSASLEELVAPLSSLVEEDVASAKPSKYENIASAASKETGDGKKARGPGRRNSSR